MTDKARTTALARKHLDNRLNPLQGSEVFTRPPKGWLRAVRDALGMTTRQFALRLGVSQVAMRSLETNEARDSITLGKLRKAAEALDCELVYALVPRKPLQKLIEDRAAKIADTQLARTHHSMRLEDQALRKADLEDERKRLVDELLRANPSRLWDGL